MHDFLAYFAIAYKAPNNVSRTGSVNKLLLDNLSRTGATYTENDDIPLETKITLGRNKT